MTENSNPQPLGASRSIYYSLTDEVPGLTDDERQKLESVMIKAMEFEEEVANRQREPLEGVLCKYTNVVKGWQYRSFVLTPDTGMLEYFIVEERKKSRPRGGMHLAGASVVSGEEDSFVVNAVYGEVYKLKASDPKEKQEWIDKIQFVIDKYSNTKDSQRNDLISSTQTHFAKSNYSEEQHQRPPNLSIPKSPKSPADASSITKINESVSKAIQCQKVLAKSIEDLPIKGESIKCSDNRLLLIKAISQATVQSLEQCFLILRKQREILRCTKVFLVDKIKPATKRSP